MLSYSLLSFHYNKLTDMPSLFVHVRLYLARCMKLCPTYFGNLNYRVFSRSNYFVNNIMTVDSIFSSFCSFNFPVFMLIYLFF